MAGLGSAGPATGAIDLPIAGGAKSIPEALGRVAEQAAHRVAEATQEVLWEFVQSTKAQEATAADAVPRRETDDEEKKEEEENLQPEGLEEGQGAQQENNLQEEEKG